MSPDQPKLKILIAEDDPNLGEALLSFLREKGHAVDLVRHGGEALRMLNRYTYSLILTDLVMPEADGLTVLRAARQRDPASLGLIMTGHASLGSALEAIREGAYHYLRKPFHLQEIEVAVDNAARLLHLREENGRLLEKLAALKAQLEELLQARKLPESGPPPVNRTGEPQPGRTLLGGVPLPGEAEQSQQADLERWLRLYKENLLTEREFQTLKERILI